MENSSDSPTSKGNQRHIRRRRMMSGLKPSAAFDPAGGDGGTGTTIDTTVSPSWGHFADLSTASLAGMADSGSTPPVSPVAGKERAAGVVPQQDRREQKLYLAAFCIAILGLWLTGPTLWGGLSALWSAWPQAFQFQQAPPSFSLVDLLGHPQGGPGRAIRLQRPDGKSMSEDDAFNLRPLLRTLERSSTLLLECSDEDLAWVVMGWKKQQQPQQQQRAPPPHSSPAPAPRAGGRGLSKLPWGRQIGPAQSAGGGGSGGDLGYDAFSWPSSLGHDRCMGLLLLEADPFEWSDRDGGNGGRGGNEGGRGGGNGGNRGGSGVGGGGAAFVLDPPLRAQENALLENAAVAFSKGVPPTNRPLAPRVLKKFLREARAELSERVKQGVAEVAVALPELGLGAREINALLALRHSFGSVDSTTHERYFWFGAAVGGVTVGLFGFLLANYLQS